MIKDGADCSTAANSTGSQGKSPAAPAEQNSGEAPAAMSFPFEELKPKIGDAIKLQVKDERYPVTLIGYVKGRTIMVSTPVVDGGIILLRDGQPVVVRSFSGKDAYAFSSSILRVCNTPLPYLHLAYPKSVQCIVVRKSARAGFDLIGSVTNTDKPEMVANRPVRINDLSIAGASFIAAEQVGEKGDKLSLSFRVKLNDIDISLATTVNCIVRSVISEPDMDSATDKLRYGVQFIDVPTDIFLLLQNMIYQKLLESV